MLRNSKWLFIGVIVSLVVATPSQTTVWNFDADPVGAIAAGFTNNSGEWKVAADNTAPSAPNVLAQTGNSTYNLALIKNSSYKDLDISVKVKAVSGGTDKGGGFVWRAKDDKNYYVIRYNPGESFQPIDVRKMINGQRTMIGKVDKLACDNGWHQVRVTMKAEKITVYFDGTQILEANDTQFPEVGMVGLWSKANAVSNFDDFTVSTLVTTVSSGVPTTPQPLTISQSGHAGEPRMKIGYCPTLSGRVSLEVFDVAGVNRAMIYDAYMPSGPATFFWNQRDVYGHLLPSGCYLLRYADPEQCHTLPFRLMK